MSSVLTVKQAAGFLGLSAPRVYRLIWDGRLAARKLGRDYVINAEDLRTLRRFPHGRPRKVERVAPPLPRIAELG